jgi:hypothetical protein
LYLLLATRLGALLVIGGGAISEVALGAVQMNVVATIDLCYGLVHIEWRPADATYFLWRNIPGVDLVFQEISARGSDRKVIHGGLWFGVAVDVRMEVLDAEDLGWSRVKGCRARAWSQSGGDAKQAIVRL